MAVKKTPKKMIRDRDLEGVVWELISSYWEKHRLDTILPHEALMLEKMLKVAATIKSIVPPPTPQGTPEDMKEMLSRAAKAKERSL